MRTVYHRTARPVCRICLAQLMTYPLGQRLVWAQPSAPPALPAAAVAKGNREAPVTRDSRPSLHMPPPTSPARGAGPLPPPWALLLARLSPSSPAPALGRSLLPADPLPTAPQQVQRWLHRAPGTDQREPILPSPAHLWLRTEGSCPICRETRVALSLPVHSRDRLYPLTLHLEAPCIQEWVPTPKALQRALMDLKEHSMAQVTTLSPQTTGGVAATVAVAPG